MCHPSYDMVFDVNTCLATQRKTHFNTTAASGCYRNCSSLLFLSRIVWIYTGSLLAQPAAVTVPSSQMSSSGLSFYSSLPSFCPPSSNSSRPKDTSPPRCVCVTHTHAHTLVALLFSDYNSKTLNITITNLHVQKFLWQEMLKLELQVIQMQIKSYFRILIVLRSRKQ